MSETDKALGLEIGAYLSPEDNVLVIHVDSPGVEDDDKGPRLRMYLNDGDVYANPPYPGPKDGIVPCLDKHTPTVSFDARPLEDGVKDSATRYAETAWSFGDVTSLEAWNQDWTPDQAEEFLQQNGKAIRDRLIAVGFEVMEDLLATWTPEKTDDRGNETGNGGETGTEEPPTAG